MIKSFAPEVHLAMINYSRINISLGAVVEDGVNCAIYRIDESPMY
jgi:hypothetical protein